MLQAHVVSSFSRCFSRAASDLKNVDVSFTSLCNLKMRKQSRKGGVACLSDGRGFVKKINVVEHICLFKAKEGLSEEKEKNMLDYLYTSQYQMRGILSISVGRIVKKNHDAYTHALYVRFQKKEDIVKFYENPFQLKVLEEHVTPYCHGRIILDFESEVEDEIIPIFRKGEEFNYGIEFVLLLAFSESASSGQTEDAMASFASMILEFPSLIVQSTQGRNFNINSTEYTDVVVIRLRSIEAFEIFVGSTEYKAGSTQAWNSVSSLALLDKKN
ncbi:hypothetical protein QQ045_020970 [Rhodiola kirilowii]